MELQFRGPFLEMFFRQSAAAFTGRVSPKFPIYPFSVADQKFSWGKFNKMSARNAFVLTSANRIRETASQLIGSKSGNRTQIRFRGQGFVRFRNYETGPRNSRFFIPSELERDLERT